METRDQLWTCPMCGRVASRLLSSCPLCHTPRQNPAPSQDNQGNNQQRVAQPSAATRTRKRNYSKAPEASSAPQPNDPPAEVSQDEENQSTASGFFIIIAWVLFIGGLFVAYQSANIPVSSYRSEFNWTVFLQIYIVYAVAGGFAICASEVCRNIQSIANSLKKLESKE